MNEKITFLKKATLHAVIGHGVALLFLFLAGLALSKNEDPGVFIPAVALVAFFIGSLVCGIVSGKSQNGPLGSVASGLVFVILILVLSLILGAFSDGESTEDGYSLIVKGALMGGSLLVSSLVGLWISSTKNGRRRGSARRGK